MFQPFLNPIGFGASDYLELLVVAPALLLILFRGRVAKWAGWLAAHPVLGVLGLGILPVALRLALLAHHPVPTPDLYDEFTHLLVADTLRHLRLANPVHPFHAFFETFFVLQEPSYSAIYPIGQGATLAAGWMLFGTPWAGVLICVGALCALCYWMLRAWVSPEWALLGGLVSVTLFGPLSYWTNTYWGGAASAAAGCAVFGALPRLAERGRARDALWLGLGLAAHLLIRPFESIFLLAAVASYSLVRPVRIKLLLAAAIVALPAVGVMALQNRLVTGKWLTLPLVESQRQYGVPTTFVFQANPLPERTLTPQQQMAYRQQASFHGDAAETVQSYVSRLEHRARSFRFFLPAGCYLALPFFLMRLRERRFAWVAGATVLFWCGSNFYPFFFPHYVAATAGLVVLMGVAGLERLLRVSTSAAAVVGWLAIAPFCLWYGVHLFEDPEAPLPVLRFEMGDVLNHGNPERRVEIGRRLEAQSGRQLVFVRYSDRHRFQDEWVYNAADIDSARIVWARDLGAVENERLRSYYKDRKAWLLEPDSAPPRLSEYAVEPVSVPVAPVKTPDDPARKPVLRFEEVR